MRKKIQDFGVRILIVSLFLSAFIAINIACCEADTNNKETKEIEKKIDTLKTGKCIYRDKQRAWL